MTTHEDISKRAREIWEREGRPEGRDKEHWLQAEAELQREQGSNAAENGNPTESTVSRGESVGSLKDENGRRRNGRRGK